MPKPPGFAEDDDDDYVLTPPPTIAPLQAVPSQIALTPVICALDVNNRTVLVELKAPVRTSS
jgi:hypothetical protein